MGNVCIPHKWWRYNYLSSFLLNPCSFADRLRDTLIHEMCHAATWLMNNVRDGHGPFWKIYARKATLVHPELPMVTRCHSYDINYKYQYQCNRCKNTWVCSSSNSSTSFCFFCFLRSGQLCRRFSKLFLEGLWNFSHPDHFQCSV